MKYIKRSLSHFSPVINLLISSIFYSILFIVESEIEDEDNLTNENQNSDNDENDNKNNENQNDLNESQNLNNT